VGLVGRSLTRVEARAAYALRDTRARVGRGGKTLDAYNQMGIDLVHHIEGGILARA